MTNMKNVNFVCTKCGRRIKFTYSMTFEWVSGIVCSCGKYHVHSNNPQGKILYCIEDKVVE